MRKLKKKIYKTAAFLFAAVLALSSAGCVGLKDRDNAAGALVVTGAVTEHHAEVKNESLHLIDEKRLTSPMASSGLMQLFLDNNSLGVALYETSKEKYWYSLPLSGNERYDSSAAVVNLVIGCGNDLYYVNSQDNSVAYKNAVCDVLGDEKLTGFVAKYVITVNDTVANKIDIDRFADGLLTQSDFLKTDIAFEVDVTYELRDGNLYISASWKNLSGNENAYIERMGLLEFFGASYAASEGDFILVPDGCGAVISTAQDDSEFKPLSFRVYGDDAQESESGQYRAVFPAFGARQGSNAFVIIIESGDAVASISADRASGVSGFNTVGASFEITETVTVTKDGVQTKYISSSGYSGEIRLCVRLLGGGSAGFDGMAAACREQFMRNGIISVSIAQNEENLPFYLSVIGSSSDTSRLIKKLETVNSFTSFEQAQDLLSRMKAKGINNIKLRYKGALDGGVNQSEIGKVSVSSRLGGKRDFEKLVSYTKAQGDGLYLDISMLTWNSDKLVPLRTARSLTGSNLNISVENTMADFAGPVSFRRFLAGYENAEDIVVGIITGLNKLGVEGICVNDAGRLVYSDYSKGFTDRQAAAAVIAESIAPLSTSRMLMVDTGNFYAIKKAGAVVSFPLSPGAAVRTGKYDSVPFAQMIVHGTVSYCGEPINLSEDTRDACLRYIEYGACPCYEWCYDVEDAQDNPFSYDNSLSEAADFYRQANAALTDLCTLRITDHYMTKQSGVYCTEYENGCAIYVNYNDTAAQVNGITVEAKSFLKIN